MRLAPTRLMTRMTRKALTDDDRWRAVRERDAACDGRFYYGVVTTGIYCRPSCPSRQPLRENVRFFDTIEAAEAAGLRACRRCRPTEHGNLDRRAEQVAGACRAIEESEREPKLEELAALAGLSPHHFHRVFKRVTGLTPKAYARACREQQLRQELGRRETVTEAIFDAGYGSSARFYEQAGTVLGMKPRSWREGGAGETIRFALGECSLGSILVAATDRGVCSIALGDDPEQLLHELEGQFGEAELLGGDAAFEELVARVVGLVEEPGLGHDLPLDIRGTAFQQRVWAALRRIPPGRTVSYAELAEAIGAPGSARAVARACADNRLAVAIPCHRVVRADGSLSGYRWGVARKERLLRREEG